MVLQKMNLNFISKLLDNVSAYFIIKTVQFKYSVGNLSCFLGDNTVQSFSNDKKIT